MTSVSVVIPCYMEENYIEKCINSVRGMRLDGIDIEILIVDGMSKDRTREIVTRIANEDPRVRLIDNPDRIQSAGLNRAIAVSKGEIVVRMDAHAEYDAGYIEQCVNILAQTGADNVGGAQRVKWDTPFQECVARAYRSPLGSGGAAYRDPTKEGYVDTVWMGAFRKSVFEKIGGFDSVAVTNEDAEFNARILRHSGKIYLSPRIIAHYYPRNTLSKLAMQYFKYGKGRIRSLIQARVFRLRAFAPFALYSVMGLLLLLSYFFLIVRVVLLTVLACYLLAVILESFRISRGGRWYFPIMLAAILMTMHAAHAGGVWSGLLFGHAYLPPSIPAMASRQRLNEQCSRVN